MTLLSGLIGLANTLTQSLGVASDVTHIPAVPVDGSGKDIGAGVPVTRKGIVNRVQKLIRTSSGTLVQSTAYVAFLDPAPVSEHDTIILPDGTTGPILNTTGFIDGSNGPILWEIYLG